jgi:holin-like protein
MLVLTAALRLRIIRLDWIKPASDLLLNNITFFFLPTCVSIILYLDLLRDHWWRLLLAVVAGTVLVLALTGWTYQILSRRSSRHSHSESSQG